MSDKLLPCPLCGSTAKYFTLGMSDGYPAIKCTDPFCGITVSAPTYEAIEAKWNRRASPQVGGQAEPDALIQEWSLLMTKMRAESIFIESFYERLDRFGKDLFERLSAAPAPAAVEPDADALENFERAVKEIASWPQSKRDEFLTKYSKPAVESGGDDEKGMLENKIELLKEDIECLHMNLDEAGIPRNDGRSNVYSMWGRVKLLLSKEALNDNQKLWLWRNGDHYLAFPHEYPCYEPGGDPMTLGNPAAMAIYRKSFDRTPTTAAQQTEGKGL